MTTSTSNRRVTPVLGGGDAHPAGGVRRAVGRRPRYFGDLGRDAAATGAWNRRRDR
jgi:hypothetical protein